MFIEDYRKVEGKLVYNSWPTNMESFCRVIFIIRNKLTKVIVFQRYMHEGTSPTNCYEDIAKKIYIEQLSKIDVKSIQWYLYYVEAKKVVSSADHSQERPLCGKSMMQITMDWQGDQFKNLQFNHLTEDSIRGILETSDVPSDLYWEDL